jgi:hypothetical protein
MPEPEPMPTPEPVSVPEPAPEPVYVPEEPAPAPVYVQDSAPEPAYSPEPMRETVYVQDPAPTPTPEQVRKPEKKTAPVAKKKKKKSMAGLWIILGLVLLAGLGAFFFFGRPKYEMQAEKERAHYDNMVGVCRDSIRSWSDFRGTVPTEALSLLSQIKEDERLYGEYADGFDASSGMARTLIDKMELAVRKWEAAGDAQKAVNPSMARECYDLALKLAESIESVERNILGKDGGKARSTQIRTKIDNLN